MDAFVINLADATERMRAFRRRCARHLGDAVTVHRVEAVDGRRGRLPLRDVDLTPRTRYYVERRVELPDLVTLHGPEAVACLLSHRRCWERVTGCTLILEDDAGLGPSLRRWLRGDGERLRRDPDAWDLVILGYQTFPLRSADARRRLRPADGAPSLLAPLPGIHRAIFGSHCYLVSPAGARRLLEVSAPMELHTDALLLMASSLGMVRGYVARPESLCDQCHADGRPRRLLDTDSIPHVQPGRTNWKVLLPDGSIAHALALSVVVTVLLLWCWWWGSTGRARAARSRGSASPH